MYNNMRLIAQRVANIKNSFDKHQMNNLALELLKYIFDNL